MPVSPSNIVLVSLVGECFGQRILLTHHYRMSGAGAPTVPTSTGLDNLLEALNGGATLLMQRYKACLPPDYEMTEARAQVIWPTRSAYHSSNSYDGAGTYAGTTETSNQTAVVSLRTENAGRNQISNKHIGPLPLGAQVNGYISDAYDDKLETLAQALLQPTTVPEIDLVASPIIYHRTGELMYDALVGYVIGRTVRTQRRRTVGLGE